MAQSTDESEGLTVHGHLSDMLCKCVSILTVNSQSLEEKECEETSRDEKDDVADHCPEEELGNQYKAETDELVTSVAKKLQEWR